MNIPADIISCLNSSASFDTHNSKLTQEMLADAKSILVYGMYDSVTRQEILYSILLHYHEYGSSY